MLLCANQIETLTSTPPGHTWGICLFVCLRWREFDRFFQVEGGEFDKGSGI